ncbi:hypothetical protein, partial [Treponema sp.]|uniref:hypothetical protein n=1 Tax=Treponema sp. TaxID=166 RepID=UPI00298E0FC1
MRYTDPDGRDTNLPFVFDKSYMLDNIPSECVKAIYDQEYKTFYNNSLYKSDKISVDVYKGSYFASFVLDLELDIQKQDNEDVGKKI